MDGGDSLVSSASKVDHSGKSTGSCKSHKEAERRRRQRINAHLSTLRSLLPNTAKTDKASLLAEVVQHVRELRRKAADVAHRDWTEFEPAGSGDAASPTYRCDVIENEGDGKLVKATVWSEEERPGLSLELGRTVRAVRGRAVRAEITRVGGGTRIDVVVEFAVGGGEEGKRALKRALKAVVENWTSGSVGLAHNKRARVSSNIG